MSKNDEQRKRYDAALELMKELGESERATFSAERVVPNAPGTKKAATEAKRIPLYGQYADLFYDSRPSAELAAKERERFFQKDVVEDFGAKEIRLLEEGLCAKYKIIPPKNIPNTVRNGSIEDDEHVLAIGTTINDRRHPVVWGINQLDRTYHTHCLGPSGSGKATTDTTKVLVKGGFFKEVKRLKIGDEVYTMSGTLAKVTHIFPQGECQVWEVILKDGRSCEVNSDHLWTVFVKSHGEYKEVTMSTKEMYDKGIKTGAGYRYRIPLCKPVEYEYKELPIHPYVLGCLIGDGCITGNKSIRMSSADTEIIAYMEHCLGNNHYFFRKDSHSPESYSWTLRYYDGDKRKASPPKEIVMALQELGLLGKYAHEKTIPEIYLRASIEQRKELLRGLMDTDGTSHQGRFAFTTSSVALRDDFRHLVWSLGIDNNVREDYRPNKYVNVDSCWDISLMTNDYDTCFHLERKKEEYKKYRSDKEEIIKEHKRGTVAEYDGGADPSDLPIHPYVLGILLKATLHQNAVMLGRIDDIDYIKEQIETYIPEVEFEQRSSGTQQEDKFVLFVSGGTHWNGKRINALLEQVRSLELDVTQKKRFIPESYLYSSSESRQMMLQGFCDYAGHIHGRFVEFAVVSDTFAKDLSTLLDSLGYTYTISIITKTTKQFKIEICDESLFANPDSKKKCESSLNKGEEQLYRTVHNDAVAITDIRPTDRTAPMRCICVDDPTHTYIIEDFVVTHNSTLLRQMVVQDEWYHRGGLLLEPHGDLSWNCLMAAPPYRIHDTIYLNVLDRDYSPGFNPLDMPENVTDAERYESISEVVSLMRKHFEVADSSVRLLKSLENALTALSYVPGATILETMDFYNNPDVQATVLSFMPDGPIKDQITAIAVNAKADELMSLENRISRFTSNRLLKHLFGQSHSTIDFYKEMNRGAMVICPVPKGGTKDDFFLHFYGEYIISVIYKSAMMRETMDEKDRVIFPLTIDEFQNFMSGDIENMLAELRKYGLPLCLAHQYLGQLGKGIWDAINNSCRTKLTYRLGSNDAPVIARAFPGCTADDLMSIQKYHIMAQPLIHGQEQRPFITKLFLPLENLSPVAQTTADLIIELSRQNYMSRRDDIDKEITQRKERLASGNKDAVIELAKKKNK